MGHFAKQLSAQEIKQGYALLNLMEHLDREMDPVSYTHLTLPTICSV